MKTLLSIVVTLVVAAWASLGLATDATLTWNANTESDLAGYRIYFAPQGCTVQGPLAPLMVGSPAAPAQVGKVTVYKHVGLPVMDGTLCWEITAFDTSGNESMHSARVSKAVNMVPPVAPTGLDAVIQ